MRLVLHTFIILLSLCLQQAVSSEPSQRRVATQSTFGSINNFQSIFKSSIQETTDSLKQQPNQQQSILSDLHSEISNATIILIDNLLEDFKEFDVSESAALISLAVENALTQLQQSPFYTFDIDTIVINVQDDMEDILKFASKENSDTSKNQKQLERMVQSSVETNFGIDFFQIDDSQLIYSDTLVKSSDKQIIGSKEIIQLLNLDDAEGAKKMFERVLIESSQSEVVSAIVDTLKEASLQETLIDTMVKIFSDVDFPIQPFSIALGVAFQDFKQTLSELLGKVIIELKNQSSKEGIAEALAFALAQDGNTSEMYNLALRYAVNQGGCTNVAQLLVQAQEKAVENGVLKPFQNAIQQNARLSECKKVGEELSVTVQILKVLDEPDKAFTLIQEAVKKQQDAAIATSIIEGIDAGKEAEVAVVLQLLFTDANIPAEQLTLQLSLILTSGDDAVITEVIKAVEQLKLDELELIANAVFSALLSGKSGQELIFINLLKQSINNKECSMKAVMDAALREASQQKLSQVLQIVSDHPEIQPCIDQNLTSTPAPIPSTPAQSHPKFTTHDIPSPTLPTAVPETLTLSPLNIGPSTEIVLQFSSILSDMNDKIADEVAEVPQQDSDSDSKINPPQVEKQNSENVSPSSTPTPTPQSKELSQSTDETCLDVAPPGTFTCEEQAKFGKCVRAWMQSGGFCRKTCGQCSPQSNPPTPIPSSNLKPTFAPTPTPSPSPAELQSAVVHSPAVQYLIDPSSNIKGEKCVVDEDLLLKVAKLAVEEYLKSRDKQEAQ